MSSHCVCKRGREGELAHVPKRVWVLALLLCGSCWTQTQDSPFFLPKTKIPHASPSPVHLPPASTWTPDISVTCLTMTSTGRDIKRCKMLQEVCGVSKPKIMSFSSPKLKSSQWLSEALAKPLCTCLGVLSRYVCQLLKSAPKEEQGTWRLSPLFNPYICYSLLLPKGLNCLNTSISRWKSVCMQGQPDIAQVGRTEMKSSSPKKDGARTQWGQFSERSRGAEKIRCFFVPMYVRGGECSPGVKPRAASKLGKHSVTRPYYIPGLEVAMVVNTILIILSHNEDQTFKLVKLWSTSS